MENVVVRALFPLLVRSGNELSRLSHYVIPFMRRLNRIESRLRGKYISQQFNFSIGIYCGNDLATLKPHPLAHNPVLRREDVTDVDADLVADPFMIQDNGRWFMFFEVLNRETKLGEIALATSNDGLTWQYERVVLVEPYHLSYPCVFVHQGRYLMIPETKEAGDVHVYEAESLDGIWRRCSTLLDVAGTDPSLFVHQGRWWMFLETSTGTDNDQLRLYYADELEGTWTEHPESPILDHNPCFSRPAGRVIRNNGKLIRFGQDSVPEYGTRVWAFEIEVLTCQHYRERSLRQKPFLAPSSDGWNENGMHHIDAHHLEDGTWLACVDGR